MKPSIVRCSEHNYLCLLIRMREVLHFRQTLSTGKIQILQLPFCNKVGLDTFTDYNLPKIEDGNDRLQLIVKDMKTYPHHYDEDDDEPDYDVEEMQPAPEPVHVNWADLIATTWTTTNANTHF
jgi:hypothetical protein